MSNTVIFTNEFLSFTSINNEIYIETFKKGFPFDQLNTILSLHPELEITSFIVLKGAINNAPKPSERVGKLKERIVVEIFDQDLKAIVIYNLSKEELDVKNRANLLKETLLKLKEKGVVYGVKTEFLQNDLTSGTHYIAAEGRPPEHGQDSIIKMYELQETHPEIHQNGKVDFYELKLINRANPGDWLGERLDATKGKPGQSIKGTSIKANDGKTLPLVYDKSSISEIYENKKTTLYSKISGAINYIDQKITVSNHLEINGDIDFKTGNIKFDGYLTIKGTVADGFSVIATKDIEINGELGLGNVREIISSQGSVFIKGGVASKGKVEIRAAKNIFTKFIENTYLVSGDTIHIGFYSINSVIKANEIVLDASNGLIVGGSATASVKISVPIIGSEIEKRTVIEVTGFDRDFYKQEMERNIYKISMLKDEQQKTKIAILHLDEKGELDPFKRKDRNDLSERAVAIKDEIKELEEKRKNITEYLKAKGEGEICVSKKIFPNCQLIIKGQSIETTSTLDGKTLYYSENQIHEA